MKIMTSADIKIKLLKSAKRTLQRVDYKQIYFGICASLEEDENGHFKKLAYGDLKFVFQLQRYLSEQLDKSLFLPDYLAKQGYDTFSNKGMKFVRKARLQWIDWMIDSLQEFGDEQFRE